MRRRAKIAVITAVCVLGAGTAAAIAAPVIYRDIIAAPAADVPMLTVDDSALDPQAGETLDIAALSGTWSIAEGSAAGYRVDEVLNGTDVTVTGRTSRVTGSLTVDGLALTAAAFEVDVASITTDSASRDDYFRDEALQAGRFPTATFVLTAPAEIDTAPVSGEAVEQQFTGDLTLAGVTRSVTFIAQARTDGATAEIAGQIPIVFADFGITAPSLGFVSVEPEGFVEFELVLTRS